MLKDYTTEETSLITLNQYLSLKKTGAHSTGELFRATMALLFYFHLCEYNLVASRTGRVNIESICSSVLVLPDKRE